MNIFDWTDPERFYGKIDALTKRLKEDDNYVQTKEAYIRSRYSDAKNRRNILKERTVEAPAGGHDGDQHRDYYLEAKASDEKQIDRSDIEGIRKLTGELDEKAKEPGWLSSLKVGTDDETGKNSLVRDGESESLFEIAELAYERTDIHLPKIIDLLGKVSSDNGIRWVSDDPQQLQKTVDSIASDIHKRMTEGMGADPHGLDGWAETTFILDESNIGNLGRLVDGLKPYLRPASDGSVIRIGGKGEASLNLDVDGIPVEIRLETSGASKDRLVEKSRQINLEPIAQNGNESNSLQSKGEIEESSDKKNIKRFKADNGDTYSILHGKEEIQVRKKRSSEWEIIKNPNLGEFAKKSKGFSTLVNKAQAKDIAGVFKYIDDERNNKPKKPKEVENWPNKRSEISAESTNEERRRILSKEEAKIVSIKSSEQVVNEISGTEK